MKLTPEQIEEQRPIFVAEWTKDHCGNPIDENGYFWRKDAEECFKYWLAAIESQPKREIILPESTELHGTFDTWHKHSDLVVWFKSQGFTAL